MKQLHQIDVRAIDLEDLGISIAFVTTDSPERKAVAKANAKLIYAAPDLLAACQSIVEYARLIESDKTEGLVDAYAKAFEDAVAAVAKATGGEA
jgi:hypothetical protein